MSGSVRSCWRCGKNTLRQAQGKLWVGKDCVHCGAPEEPCCPECGGPPDERVLAGMKCGRCAYGG